MYLRFFAGIAPDSLGSQFLEQEGKYQGEKHAQNGVCDTQHNSIAQTIDTGCQHQRAKAVESGFITIVPAEAKAQTAQRPQQEMQGIGCNQVNDQISAGACENPDDTLPETSGDAVGIGIFTQQGGAGKAHPHEPFHAEEPSRGQHQTNAQSHTELPQMDNIA